MSEQASTTKLNGTRAGSRLSPTLTQGVLIACVLLSLFVLFYPIYVIRPFRYQGSRELAFALAVMRFRPLIDAVCIFAAAFIVVFSWSRAQTWLGKTGLVLSAALVILFAGLSRINIYELMFHPLDRPRFLAAADTKLDGQQEVVAVTMHGIARAYPIRSMSYHHIVNDSLGGVPIVATY